MAHDFCITRIDESGERREHAFFFGYAGGLMYWAFDAMNHDARVSGDNGREVYDYKTTRQSLEKAIVVFDRIGYPDPHRLDGIKEFYRLTEGEHTSHFEAWFS